MASTTVLLLLTFDLLLFFAAVFFLDAAARRTDTLLLCGLFFLSGMPALVYQIVWQRALFAIYGVNAESVAVVVSAFMLGLGLGSLAGGWLSARFPQLAIVLFGAAELGVAVFGLCSLKIFHWAAGLTAGASLPATLILSLALLIVPTMLMGATLPLLVEHLVRTSGRVGFSVATLYFVNTFGSAVACYLCAAFVLREFGQSGSVSIAACLNTLVGATAFLYGRSQEKTQLASEVQPAPAAAGKPAFPLAAAMLISAMSGFVALGFEISWFRVFSLASADRAPAFALLLSTFLAGIAAGAYLTEKAAEKSGAAAIIRLVGMLLLAAGTISPYLPPLVGWLMWRNIPFLWSAPAFFLTAALLGAVLPLLCQLAVSADQYAGRSVSWIYVSNIFGSTLGSLLVGFVLMHHFGLRQVSHHLALAAVLTGATVLLFNARQSRGALVGVFAAIILAAVAVPIASHQYGNLFERLIFGQRPEANIPFAHVVENRNGVIAVTQDSAIFGGGVYDGYFNIDPRHDVNIVARIYALSALHPNPNHVLMIGLASGSWAQIVANHPQVESLDVVEINPGHLQLIPLFPEIRTLLDNPKVHIYVDDGRRWLQAHPEARYDAIVANTSYYWRDHGSDLLSVEFLEIIRRHLNPGGIFYYNTTTSDDVVATGLHIFPYGLRVVNFLAVSDSPFHPDVDHWMRILRDYRIDNHTVLPVDDPASQVTLSAYAALAESLKKTPRFVGMESSESLNSRLGRRLIITDDNMGWEWRGGITIPWRSAQPVD